MITCDKVENEHCAPWDLCAPQLEGYRGFSLIRLPHEEPVLHRIKPAKKETGRPLLSEFGEAVPDSGLDSICFLAKVFDTCLREASCLLIEGP